jgi:Carboxypeptidase regulatory-like domain/TonB dependent receptor
MKLRTFCAAAILLYGWGLFGQAGSLSQISGTVRDSTGSLIPSARITATQTDTGLTRSATSGSDGGYTIPNLPIGPYKLEVRKEGFSSYSQSGIVLQVDSSPTIEVTMQVGAVNQEVNVEAAAAMVETSSSGVGQVVDQQRVVDLPLNGRQPTQLITLSGAAVIVPTANSGQLISQKNYPNEVSISVAGGPANGLTYSLDGGTHNDPVNNAGLPLPFPDALQEFKIETSALQAQYGQHSGGAVNAVTKSGSNAFHGDAFEFVRNRIFNARDTFSPTKDTLRRNQFGGTFGGPIEKNKLFFFLGYQQTIQSSDASSAYSYVPTAQMLQGDFTSCNNGVTLKAPFVNNMIAPSLFSPVALKMLTYYPQPTGPCGQVYYTTINNFSEQFGVAKIDYQLNQKHTLFGRYLVTHALQPASYTGTPLSLLNASPNDLVNSITLGDTYVVSPTTLNSLRLTFDRAAINKNEVVIMTAADLGINITAPPIPNNIYITVTGALYSAGANSFAAAIPTQSFQAADDFNMLRGAHQLQFGADYVHEAQNATFLGTTAGSFSFTGQVTGLPLADFLLGKPASFGAPSLTIDSERHEYIGLYAQDSWRIGTKLKLNYGLRWEPYIGGSLGYGHVSHFDEGLFANNVHSTVYPNAPAGVEYPGDPGFNTNNRPNNIKWNNFAPRVGAIYDPHNNGKMTIRASWGMFYDFPHTLFYDAYGGTAPWAPGVTIPTPAGGFANPWQGYPGGNPFPIYLTKDVAFPTSAGYLTVPLNLHTTYLEQWNLSIQRQLGNDWLASASYLGNNTIHMWAPLTLDPSVYIAGNCTAGQYGLTAAGPCSSLGNTASRRLLTLINPTQGAYISNVSTLDDGATASYNALLLSVQHRLASNFTIFANYTWSHCIADPVTTAIGGSYTDPNDRRFDRGNCGGIDIRHVFNLSGVLQSPRFSNRTVQAIAGNWQLAPIVGWHSGNTFTVTTGVDNALVNTSGQRPNLAGDPYCTTRSANCYLNPAAFTAPANGTFGNLAANGLFGPSYFQVDLSLSRRFIVHERHSLEFRADVFNTENRVNLSVPVSTPLTASNFGRITSDITATGSGAAGTTTGDPRTMQLSLKYAF